MRNVDITSEPMQLYKILKFEGLVSNGGEAKAAVAEGLVRVNGQTETRKRKQIVSGCPFTRTSPSATAAFASPPLETNPSNFRIL